MWKSWPLGAMMCLDHGTRKLVGRSPPAASAQLKTYMAVHSRSPWIPVVEWVGGHLGGHSCAKVEGLNGMAPLGEVAGRLPTSVGTVTACLPWLLSRKNVEAASWRADD